MQRRRFKNILSFPDRLDQEIERLRAEAEKLPPGNHEREMLLRKARQAETALRVNDWLSSPGLQSASCPASIRILPGHAQPALKIDHVTQRDQSGAVFGGDRRRRAGYSGRVADCKKGRELFGCQRF